ncbi:MAG: AAA family ATPase [Chitinophagales bacterium]
MKISEIHIKNFRQFEDLKLNLTYPKDHPTKAGRALDKVCIIGQSGTGKTTLLKILREGILSSLYNTVPTVTNAIPKINFGENEHVKVSCIQYLSNGIGVPNYKIGNRKEDENNKSRYKPKNPQITKQLLYFPENLTNVKDFEEIQFTSVEERKKTDTLFQLMSHFFYFEFNQDTAAALWRNHLNIINKHRNLEVDFRIALTKRAEKESVDIKSAMEHWRAENPNPLKKLADECLDKLLNKLHLATKTEIDSVEELNTIQIQLLKEGKTIPYQDLSTGTKQILYTAFPLYYLLQKDTIVLMDQPENSLYPDMQTQIVPFYLSLNKKEENETQFFFATHSPLIASSFEPWEIVELKFDEKGKVYREKYYTGEGTHIDDYFLDPRYLRWDSILTKVFDLEEEGNTSFRAKKLMEFSILKNQLTTLKDEGKLLNPTPETQKTIEAYKKAGQLLDWTSLNGH